VGRGLDWAQQPGQVVVATRNRGKLGELRRLLRPLPWRLLDLDQAPGGAQVKWEETGASYRDNAVIKARAVCLATGLPSLGDDSGVEVRALGGWPGIHTARWMGEGVAEDELLRGLADRIAALPAKERQGTFVCALALAAPATKGQPILFVTEARVGGSLLAEPRGRRGFGYDPIFVPEGEQRTMAEMSQAHKDEISHRGRAARQLLEMVA